MSLVQRSISIGAGLLFLAVAVGAFGAHGLEALLIENDRQDAFDTASKYHFYHGFGLLILGLIVHQFPTLKWQLLIFWAMLLGTVIFSGSLYLLAILNISWFGVITPVGGLMLLISWGFLVINLIAVR